MSHLQDFEKTSIVVYHGFENSQENYLWEVLFLTGAVPKVMTATLNVVVSINPTTVMQTYWTTPTCECFCQPLSSFSYFHNQTIFFVKSILCLIFKKLEFRAK